MKTTVKSSFWMLPLLACLTVTGCGDWDQRVESAERKWFEKTFPLGMTLEEFNKLAPDAYLVDDQTDQIEYVALLKRTCFAVCATMDGGLRSRDLVDARFVFKDGRLASAQRLGRD